MGRTAFLRALPVDLASERLALESENVCDLFWTLVPAFPFPSERTQEYLVEILARGRAEAVVDALSLALHGDKQAWRPPAELITAALHGLAKSEHQVTSSTAYAVESLLNYLHRTGHSLPEVAMWEITFAGLFHDRRPAALLEQIANYPAAFVELHQFRYLPTEKLNPRAMGFYMTGESLRCIPGLTGGQVDRDRLLSWVHEARALLDEIGMRRSGDRAIGTLVSAGPDGVDGVWPAEAVRDVLEFADADELRDGFRLGLANNVGFTTRGVYDGGQQERESAAKYFAWADEIELTWPHTAQVLRDHAESLQAMGRFWDREAEDDHDE